jgi:hypothetical protein
VRSTGRFRAARTFGAAWLKAGSSKNMELSQALRAAAEALLIGFLVGAEREASREESERQPGVRDFIVIALVGAICGLLGLAYLTVAALLSIAIVRRCFTSRLPIAPE